MTCNSCGYESDDSAEFISELTFSWAPTGNHVCRDSEACFERWLSGQRESEVA